MGIRIVNHASPEASDAWSASPSMAVVHHNNIGRGQDGYYATHVHQGFATTISDSATYDAAFPSETLRIKAVAGATAPAAKAKQASTRGVAQSSIDLLLQASEILCDPLPALSSPSTPSADADLSPTSICSPQRHNHHHHDSSLNADGEPVAASEWQAVVVGQPYPLSDSDPHHEGFHSYAPTVTFHPLSFQQFPQRSDSGLSSIVAAVDSLAPEGETPSPPSAVKSRKASLAAAHAAAASLAGLAAAAGVKRSFSEEGDAEYDDEEDGDDEDDEDLDFDDKMDSDYHEGGSPSPSGGRRSRGGKPARHNSTSSTSSSTSSPTSSSAGSTRRRHPNQRRYACTLPTCTRSFTRLFNLKAHLETHNPARERGFRCEDCGVAFCRAQDLLRHGTVHDKSNLMTCPACPGKTFSRKDALRRHVRMNKCCELSDI